MSDELDWLRVLPSVKYCAFAAYGDTSDGSIWWKTTKNVLWCFSCYDTRANALTGISEAVEMMRLYRLELITNRLTRTSS
jgi:hypothetical protein